MKPGKPIGPPPNLDLQRRGGADLSNESLLQELREQDGRIAIVIVVFAVVGLIALALLAY